MERINLGIIGLGTMADRHFAAFSACARTSTAAICSASRKTLSRRMEQWNIADGYTDYQQLLKRKDIDAVLIAAPPVLHAEMTIAALRSGKHVLCEKPPAMNARQAEEMARCADEQKKLLMYGFVFRHAEKYKFAREICQSGNLGNIYFVRAESLRRSGAPGGWFGRKNIAGGGPVIDFGIHSLDTILYLLGDPEPVSVYAKTFCQTENLRQVRYVDGYKSSSSDDDIMDVEEMGTALVTLADNTEILFTVSNTAHVKQPSKITQILGSRAGLDIDPELELHTTRNGILIDEKPVVNCGTMDYQKAIDEQALHFERCLLDGDPCLCPAENGTRAMRIIDALYRSAESGKVERADGT